MKHLHVSIVNKKSKLYLDISFYTNINYKLLETIFILYSSINLSFRTRLEVELHEKSASIPATLFGENAKLVLTYST